MKFPLVPRSRHERRMANAMLEIAQLKATVSDLRQSRARLLDAASLQRGANAAFRRRAIPTILGIDVEPDARVVALADPSWRATEALFARLDDLRSRVAAASGGASLRITWFPRADPQVAKANGSASFALDHFAGEWEKVRQAGDEIGLHMHPWRWDEALGTWSQDHGDEAWVLECLRVAIAAYRKAFGRTPAAYRGGDRFLSDAVVRLLEAEGVSLDLTLERMPSVARLVQSERGTGEIPDGSDVTPNAYRASSQDFRLPAPAHESGVGMLPLTAYDQGTLIPWMPNTSFEDAVEKLVDAADAETDMPTHLAFVVRSDTASSATWEDFVENVLSLARRVRQGRLAFATASQAWEQILQPDAPRMAGIPGQ